jgi:serine/threonine protein kinase
LPALDGIRIAIGIAEALKNWHNREQPYGSLIPAAVFIRGASVELAPQSLSESSPYRAPELWLGGTPDVRTDIFALGVICHEMFSGRAPFAGADETSLKRAVLERLPDSLAETPPRLARAIAACLEKQPERRLQRIGLLLTELRLHEIECRRSTAQPAGISTRRQTPIHAAPRPEPSALTPRVLPKAAPLPPQPSPAPHQPKPPRTQTQPREPGYLDVMFNPLRRCPRCGSNDLRDSRPRNRLERGMVKARVSVLRCQRCFTRFARAGIFRLGMDETL